MPHAKKHSHFQNVIGFKRSYNSIIFLQIINVLFKTAERNTENEEYVHFENALISKSLKPKQL